MSRMTASIPHQRSRNLSSLFKSSWDDATAGAWSIEQRRLSEIRRPQWSSTIALADTVRGVMPYGSYQKLCIMQLSCRVRLQLWLIAAAILQPIKGAVPRMALRYDQSLAQCSAWLVAQRFRVARSNNSLSRNLPQICTVDELGNGPQFRSWTTQGGMPNGELS